MQEILEAVVAGATAPEIEDVDVVRTPALSATAYDALEADGYLLGTPANIGYMSGALKHFFDTIYYPCLDATKGRPYAFYVHGNLGTEGAIKSVESIAKGLEWRPVSAPLPLTGQPGKQDLEQAWELGATVAASLMA